MYNLIKPILFLCDPEKAHNLALGFFSKATFLYPLFRSLYSPKPQTGFNLSGIKFKHKVGLAAGFDKNGIAIKFWEAIGFSHIEVGTVTPLAQPGNDKPRIFRLKSDKALINRLGFNNSGADAVLENIMNAREELSELVIGVNIGKNKDTPLSEAAEDYLICLRKLYKAADYFTVNISSPNTEGLRELQGEQYLKGLLSRIQEENKSIALEKHAEPKPIFVKIAPDLDKDEVESIFYIVIETGITGIIATNTTIMRAELMKDIHETGGLSGKPLKNKADSVLKQLNELNLKMDRNKIILIGVGGVFTRNDYTDKVNAGAELVQVYTGFIYNGPSIIKTLLRK